MSFFQKKAGIFREKDDILKNTYNTTEHSLQRQCEKEDCSNIFDTFIILYVCRHSFHTTCLPSGTVACLVCIDKYAKSLAEYGWKARNELHHMDEEGDIIHDSDVADCISQMDGEKWAGQTNRRVIAWKRYTSLATTAILQLVLSSRSIVLV